MKTRSKLATIAVAALSALALTACGGPGPAAGTNASNTPAASSGATGGSGNGKKITIGFSISTLQNPYFVSMQQGINDAAAKDGVTVTLADANDDANKQANDILNFISQKVDAVVLNPTDSDAIIPSVQALNAAHIPVLTVDRTAKGGTIVAHIGTDNVTAGQVAAKTFFDAIGGKGNIAILEGVPGASPTIDRGKGIQNVLKDYPGIKVVASQTANFQRSEGLTVAQNILQAHPDIVGILSENDEMALGAVQALQAASKSDVKVIGIDGETDSYNAIKAGQMVATIAQQPALMGSQSIDQAVKVVQGETIEKSQPVDILVVTKDNVDTYLAKK